jgi:N-acetyl-anhydromuramyl-L-alanine amidase AmpD
MEQAMLSIAEEPGALVIPNQNYFAGRNGLKPRYVIVHGTAGGTSSAGIANYFKSTENTANPASSHHIIDQAGNKVQTVSESDGAWANGLLTTGHDVWWDENINPNNTTISIEHCKIATDNSNDLTDVQEAASFSLIRNICKRWNIPMRAADATGGITGHFSIDPVNRSRCPGPYPWDRLWAFLNGEIDMLNIGDPLAVHFKDAGNGIWTCDNGQKAQGEILKFYRKTNGAARLPIGPETRGQGGKIISQMYQAGIIVYDPSGIMGGPGGGGPCFQLPIVSENLNSIVAKLR